MAEPRGPKEAQEGKPQASDADTTQTLPSEPTNLSKPSTKRKADRQVSSSPVQHTTGNETTKSGGKPQSKSPKPNSKKSSDESGIRTDSKRQKMSKDQDRTDSQALPAEPTRPSLAYGSGGYSIQRSQSHASRTSRTSSAKEREDSLSDLKKTFDQAHLPSTAWPVWCSDFTMPIFNEAAWCYRRSLIEALAHVPPFLQFLDGADLCADVPCQPCNRCRLKSLMAALWGKNIARAQHVLKMFDRYVQSCTPEANDLSQANETKIKLKVKKTLQVKGKCEYNRATDGYKLWNEADEWMALKNTEADPHQYFHFIVNTLLLNSRPTYEDTVRAMFYVLRPSYWSCTGCNSDHMGPPSPDLGINLTIADKMGSDIYSYLDQYFGRFGPEEGVCRHRRCPNRNQSQMVSRMHRLVACPQVLVVQLVRMNWDRAKKRSVKIRKHINFPQMLDLERYKLGASQDVVTKYRLVAVIHHLGSTLDHGHYICIAEEPNGDFTKYDDNETGTVEGASKENLFSYVKGKQQFDPYLLFYVRQEPSAGKENP